MPTPATRRSLLTLALVTLLGLAGPAAAQTNQPSPSEAADANEASASANTSPRYLLIGSHGRAVRSEDFRGRFQLIAFGFVSCPDVCPTTMLEMQQVLAALGTRARHLQPIFITIDPQRDTVIVLDAYTRNFDARILGLTGSPELVRRAADSFKVRFEKVQEPGADASIYTMDHTAGMFVLGPDGQRVGKFAYGAPVQEIISSLNRWLDLAGK